MFWMTSEFYSMQFFKKITLFLIALYNKFRDFGLEARFLKGLLTSHSYSKPN